MANELVYYGIHDGIYRNSVQIGSEEASYGYRRATDRVIAVNRSFDPVEILPPELSLRCLLDSLQSGANSRLYQSGVLQMLNVSERWYHYMISAPLLWSEIHIDCSAPDLLATLAAFTHFSGVVPLNVVTWGDLGASWNEISAVLVPHGQRIRRLSFQTGSDDFEPDEEAHILWIEKVLGSFRSLAGLQELDFSIFTDFHSPNLDLPTIPRGVLVISTLYLSLLEVDAPMVSFRNCASITTKDCLDDIIPLLCSLSVRDLHLHGGNVAQTSASNIKLPLEAASHLKSISYDQPYCVTLDRLLRVTAHQLSHLELQVGHSTTQEMIDTLSQLVNLKHLRLHSGPPLIKTAPTLHPSCSAVIHRLNTLHIGRIGKVLDSLCMVFTTMYPSVKEVVFIGVSRVSSICAAYLTSLTSIQTLNFSYGTNISSPLPPMRLSSLQTLSAMEYHKLQYFKLPNLLALTIRFTRSSRFDNLCLPSLRKLTIDSQSGEFKLHLEPSNYPELRSLTLLPHTLRWQLSSLPKLISITLCSSIPDGHDSTLLCVALLYNPEYCPALQQISFSQPIEWDMLFLMLERRNQRTEGVSKINRIGLPFIPFILRKPLALLLKGQRVERPSNVELSFEGVRELLCDATIPGCFECLRQMRPQCSELAMPYPDSLPVKLENVFVEYPDPPGDIPTEIGDWVVRYQRLREEWKRLEIRRRGCCDLFL